ncbi:MAG: porin [Alphaproteobacteria bacterium]
MNRHLLAATALGVSLYIMQCASVVAQEYSGSADQRLQKLEQEIALIKRQREVQDEKDKTAAERAAGVEFGKRGLKITSPDKKYELSLRGTFQFDERQFFNDDNNTGKDEFLARRVRPTLEIRAGAASLRIMPEFAGATTRITDAHADYKFNEALQFRVGKFKPPVSLERLQSAADLTFIERGHASNLAPNRDLGFMVYGNLIPDVLEYQVGVFNGGADLANADGDDDDKKDVAARVFANPFRNSDLVALQGFGAGVAWSIGERDGAVGRTILGTYKSPGQEDFFRYLTTSFADGRHWRLYPQAYWYAGSLGLLAEYAISNQEVRQGVNQDALQHTAWQIIGSYVLTGEDASFKGGVRPSQDFDPGKGGIGAWEVTARAGGTDVDNDAFPRFANLGVAATRAQSYGGGLNWYVSENLKLIANYDFTTFKSGAPGGKDRPDEQALFTRAQVRF